MAVIGDCVNGWKTKDNHMFLLCLPTKYVWWKDLRQWQVKRLAGEISSDTWNRLSVGEGAKGLRIYDCVQLKLPDFGQVLPAGWGKWLLVRRSVEKPAEMVYFLVLPRF